MAVFYEVPESYLAVLLVCVCAAVGEEEGSR